VIILEGEERGKWPIYGGVAVVGIVFAGERKGHDAETKQKRECQGQKKEKKRKAKGSTMQDREISRMNRTPCKRKSSARALGYWLPASPVLTVENIYAQAVERGLSPKYIDRYAGQKQTRKGNRGNE